MDTLPTDHRPAGAQPVKRYITGHDGTTGESVYVDVPDLSYSPVPVPGFGTAARSYATTKLAPELANDEDLKAHFSDDSVTSQKRQEIIVPSTTTNPHTGEKELGGANVVNLDLEPGAVGHMHRTVSLDISTCVMGSVYHELDSGQKVLLQAGVSFIPRAMFKLE
ncbi:hypothetical protein FZEAL_4085 [Fusarium zealandicum]|uniref:Uncharacterized protein n=1 Tax=Fusarium zealandicum TaxID=1053134 RepID=A0A8H4UN45_9HYPO|nr:hypothetical protein FZEAL_4085 [Fusarium zealandicum]